MLDAKSKKHIYLAGPDVFFENPLAIAERKRELCESHDFTGVFPLDVEIDPENKLSPFEKAKTISLSNEGLMDKCDLMIANLTPFRGVSMDAGTAFEVGYMRAQGKPVLGYTNVQPDYDYRVASYYKAKSDDNPYDPDKPGTDVENFGLAENLMIEIAIHESGAEVVRNETALGNEFYDLSGFENCLKQAARIIKNV